MEQRRAAGQLDETLSKLTDRTRQMETDIVLRGRELQRKNEQLRQSEERYRALFNSIDEGFCIFELLYDGHGHPVDYCFLETNPAFERQSGLQNATGRRMRELAPDHELEWFQLFGEIVASGEAVRREMRAGGLNRWFDFYAWRVGEAADRRVAALFRDITERQRADATLATTKAQLQTLVETAPLGIYLIDHQFRISHVNSTARPVFGDTADLIGRDFDELIHCLWPQAYADEVVRIFRRTLETGEPFVAPERIEQRRDRDAVEYYEWQVHRIPLSQGHHGVVCYFREISATVFARQALEAALRAKDEFLAVLSHELRTPLTPVLLAVHTLLRRKDLPEAAVDGLRMIRQNVQLEAELVGDLLDLTSISRGKVQMRATEMDLHEAINRAVQLSRSDFEAKAQQVTLALDAREHRVQGDSARLQQVFWNLLKNASKFTPEGGAITIHTCNAAPCIVVEITDTGIGIEAEVMKRIFEPFEQGDPSIASRFGGLGIGLAIAKSTVEAHDGSLTASSPGSGLGATFKVSLPFVA
jgi:PAS domain S-box-containing protein